jgi:hypothetical protein
MARIITVSLAPVAVNLAGIAALQTTAGAGNLVLTATAIAGLDMARVVALTSTGAIGGVNFTITGTDADGNAISEVMAGPSNSTVYSTKAYLTVATIAVSGAVGTNTKAGWDGSNTLSAIAKTIGLNAHAVIAAQVKIVVTGTVNFSIEDTNDDIYRLGTGAATWTSVSALASKTSTTLSQIDVLSSGLRLKINTYSNSATLKIIISQARGRA